MHIPDMRIPRDVAMLLTLFGVLQAVAGLIAVRIFVSRLHHPLGPLAPVSILKPVCGDEPLLEEAIASFCLQQYPAFQLVIGTQDPCDPALIVVRRLQARFPACDIKVVVDPIGRGSNRKVANLMNMLPFAKHELLVFADSDLHVRPDYLLRVVAALQQPGTGLVTTVNVGMPAVAGIPALLGTTHITHSFLPGVLLSIALGRQDCLGCTMALRRETLAQAGGLGGLVEHLADDNVLGRKIRRLGLATRLADTLPVVTVQDRSFRDLWLHELRWARTIGALAPVAFTASVIQYPLLWALIGVLLSGGAPESIACFAFAWAARAASVRGIDQILRARLGRPVRSIPLWLLPARDVLSAVEIAASHWSDAVVWRGHAIRADRGNLPPPTHPAADAAMGLAEETTLPV